MSNAPGTQVQKTDAAKPAVSAKPGLIQQIASFPGTFWVANAIELVERFSFWGIRTIAALYVVEAAEKGGLGLDNTDKGVFFGTWALIQCILPMFTGGFADRYGYRASLLVAYGINMVGYGLMAWVHSWWGFMIACCLIGTGTAIFKPPLHGTLAHCVNKSNSSVGWGLFYQVVNIGAFFGPIIMGRLRLLQWKYAFLLSAGVIIVNVLVTTLLLKDYSKITQARTKERPKGPIQTFVDAMASLADLKLMLFLGITAGFWFMFMQLSDQLAVFVSQWVNTNDVATFFANVTGMEFFKNLAKDGGQFNAEWIVTVDAGSIIFLVVLVCYITGFFRHISAMIVGMFISCAGLIFAGSVQNGWPCVLGIFIFAIGEMICSPKFSEYIGLMAPPEKKALYMGYSNLPFAVGWTLANYVGGPIYQRMSDKVGLARDYLVSHLGMNAEAVGHMSRGEVLPALSKALNTSDVAATEILRSQYHPERFFYVCIGIGLVSTLALVGYHFWLEADKKRRAQGAVR
jgi:POT family proton-dependent oligopeptide transporter